VALIKGITSVAADDIRAQLREMEEAIDLVVRRVAITRPAEAATIGSPSPSPWESNHVGHEDQPHHEHRFVAGSPCRDR
jgi:hypothetical protein